MYEKKSLQLLYQNNEQYSTYKDARYFQATESVARMTKTIHTTWVLFLICPWTPSPKAECQQVLSHSTVTKLKVRYLEQEIFIGTTR